MKNSAFENYPDKFLIKVCRYLIKSNVNFESIDDVYDKLKSFTHSISNSEPSMMDISFIKNLYKLNESILNSTSTEIRLNKPQFKTYNVPYNFIEEFTMKHYMEREISCYGDSYEAGEILDDGFREAEIFIDDGNEIDKDVIHSEYTEWNIDKDDITEV